MSNATCIASGIAFATAAFAGVMALWVADQTPTVEITHDAAPTRLDATAAARAHADEHGLTGCGAPEDAALDALFLTVPSDESGQATSLTVTPVDLDEALDSAGKRLVVLACDRGE